MISFPLHHSDFILLLSGYGKLIFLIFFFFNDTATTEIYTLSLHDALPIFFDFRVFASCSRSQHTPPTSDPERSEEHTSELQSHVNLVCRLLLEKKNTTPPIRKNSPSYCATFRSSTEALPMMTRDKNPGSMD